MKSSLSTSQFVVSTRESRLWFGMKNENISTLNIFHIYTVENYIAIHVNIFWPSPITDTVKMRGKFKCRYFLCKPIYGMSVNLSSCIPKI